MPLTLRDKQGAPGYSSSSAAHILPPGWPAPQRSPGEADGQELGAPSPGLPPALAHPASGPEVPRSARGGLAGRAVAQAAFHPGQAGVRNSGAPGREPLASACHRPRQGPEPGPQPAAPRVPPKVQDRQAEWTPGWALRHTQPQPCPLAAQWPGALLESWGPTVWVTNPPQWGYS